MKKISRAIGRVFFHLSRFFLRFLEATFVRVYMPLYTRLLRFYGVKFTGKPRYISTKVKFDDFDRVEIGERVVISENVIMLTHDYSLTTGLIAIDKKPSTDMAFIKPITIKSNVFIGMNSLILPGSVINENVIIGAASVVRGIIPADSIVIGNPATVIGKLTDHAKKWEKNLGNTELSID
jgi:acetyltransferase-like isoleucine patch superfamily enzyme